MPGDPVPALDWPGHEERARPIAYGFLKPALELMEDMETEGQIFGPRGRAIRKIDMADAGYQRQARAWIP